MVALGLRGHHTHTHMRGCTHRDTLIVTHSHTLAYLIGPAYWGNVPWDTADL